MTAQASLLGLLRLCSQGLPVGGFSYSRGLEFAIDAGWVHDETAAGDWIAGVLEHQLGRLDLPVLMRLHRAFLHGDGAAIRRWSDFLHASRESRELQFEEQQMGQALARLLRDLGVEGAAALFADERTSFSVAFALAAVRWNIAVGDAAAGYLWTAAESQQNAAMRLVPLGQTAGQRILSRLLPLVPEICRQAAELRDEDLGSLTPGIALASALHETQYSRLFRS